MTSVKQKVSRRSRTGDAAETSHRIPVIDKMMTILEQIEGHEDGASINALTTSSRVPRSTVYRILNTLSSHGVVARGANGDFKLGLRLVAMAAKVKTSVSLEALIEMAHPKLAALAQATGETCKLSILREDHVEVVDVIIGTNAMTPASRVGSRFPIHAGAASKALLAFSGDSIRERLLALPKDQLTPLTIVESDRLRAEIDAIREAGVSYDRGEWNANVHAVAAPICGIDGHAVAAFSVTFFAGQDASLVEQRITGPLLEAARELSTRLGYRTS